MPAPGILHPPHCFPAKYLSGERKENCKQVSVLSQLTFTILSLFCWRNRLPMLQEVVLQLGRRPSAPSAVPGADPWSITQAQLLCWKGPWDTLCPPSCSQHEVRVAVARLGRTLSPPPTQNSDTSPPVAASHSGQGRVSHLHPDPPRGYNSGLRPLRCIARHCRHPCCAAGLSFPRGRRLRDHSRNGPEEHVGLWDAWAEVGDTARVAATSTHHSPSAAARPQETLISLLLRQPFRKARRQKAFLRCNVMRIACKFKGRALPGMALSS